MKLRELFEARQRSVGIIFGRFNPPHKGHRAAWEMASKNDAWFVGTNQSTQGPKDPLPYDVKIEAMKAIYPEIQGHIVAEQSWLTLASAVYKKYGNVVLNLYTDEEWVSKAINQYNGVEGAHGLYNFKIINTEPTPRLSSATALRAAVQAGDREAFADAAGVDADTPVAGKSFFDLVAQYLNPYAEKEKAKISKKKAKQPELNELSQDTIKSYKEKAQAQVKDLKPHAKKGEYKDIAKRMIDRRERGIEKAEKRMGEEAAGVGIITKQNSTVDVNKNTPRKNLKAFRLA